MAVLSALCFPSQLACFMIGEERDEHEDPEGFSSGDAEWQ